MEERLRTNKKWDQGGSPLITIMTPVYNRRSTILRAIESVEKQTFRNIEYVIVDDGSIEPIDDMVDNFMKTTKLPVMFVKTKNSGVHTARNVGYRHARGELILCIDSDDELLPEACEIFKKTWESIPDKDEAKYWQMKAQCVDRNGDITGTLFPVDINKLPAKDARKSFSLAKGGQTGCRVTAIMKENLFPEPDGVTFVQENIPWVPLERKYKPWGINDPVRIYHKEGNDHLSGKSKKITKQDFRNKIWNAAHMLNNYRTYDLSFKKRMEMILRYRAYIHILKRYKDHEFVKKNRLKRPTNNVISMAVGIPSITIAKVYEKRLK